MKAEIKVNAPPSQNHHLKFARLLTLLFLGILSGIALPSCANQANKPQPRQYEAALSSAPAAPAKKATREAPAPKSRPQLIKKAQLTLVVKSIDQSIKTVLTIVQKQQGDVLGLQDSQPSSNSVRHTASLQIRVPAKNLETTINDLSQLGTVESRAITAEDVSDQLVDFQARLKNLRKSEEAVLKIMERSGSVTEVLKVSQELSNIRESIERISAQLNNLQNQVAYSTITLDLEAAVSAAPYPQEPLGLRVQESWGKATHAVSELTWSLMSLIIWLLAFSPYLLLIGAGVYAYRRFKPQKFRPFTPKPELPPPAGPQSKDKGCGDW